MKTKYTRRNLTRSPLTLVTVGFIVTLALVTLGAGWSTAFGGTVPDPNSAPSNLQANGITTSQIDLRWTDNSSNEAGFSIERKTGQFGTWAEIATVGVNGAPGGYNIPCGGIMPCYGFGTIGYHDTTGLLPGTLYFYRVRAFGSPLAYSPYSNEGNAYSQSSLVVTKELDDGSPGTFSYELSQVDPSNKVITFAPGIFGVHFPAGATLPSVPTGTSIGGVCDTEWGTGPIIIIDTRNASPASRADGITLSGGAMFYGIDILGTRLIALTGGNMVYCDKVRFSYN